MTVDQVIQEVLRDRLFFDSSGGGATFSGGEPLRQVDFLLAMLQACRSHGLHTTVDTCGVARREDLLAVARWTDLFLYDLKLMSEAAHQHYTGASNQLILDNLRELGRVHSHIWVRVPFLQGVNDSEEELRAAACFAAGIPAVRQINLLPFHRTGSHKFKRIGLSPPVAEFQAPPTGTIARAINIFQQAGLRALAGG